MIGLTTPREFFGMLYIAGMDQEQEWLDRIPEFYHRHFDAWRAKWSNVEVKPEYDAFIKRFEVIFAPQRPQSEIVEILRGVIEQQERKYRVHLDVSDEALRVMAQVSENPDEGCIMRTAKDHVLLRLVAMKRRDRRNANPNRISISLEDTLNFIHRYRPELSTRVNLVDLGITPPPNSPYRTAAVVTAPMHPLDRIRNIDIVHADVLSALRRARQPELIEHYERITSRYSVENMGQLMNAINAVSPQSWQATELRWRTSERPSIDAQPDIIYEMLARSASPDPAHYNPDAREVRPHRNAFEREYWERLERGPERPSFFERARERWEAFRARP